METINKCIAVAISEYSKISFSGATVVPAGKAMEALCLASEELKLLMAKEKEENKEACGECRTSRELTPQSET